MVFKLLQQTLRTLVKNPLLLLPDIIAGVVSLLLLYFAFLYTGAGDLVGALQTAEQDILGDVLREYLSQNLAQIIIAVSAFFVITFLFGVGIDILRYELVMQALMRKKLSLQSAWKERKSYFWNIVLLRILLFCIAIILSVGIFLCIGVASLILESVGGESIANSGATVLLIVLGLSFLIVFVLSFLFSFPIMFLKNMKNPVQVLQESFRFFRAHASYVLVTGVVILCISLLSGIFTYAFGKSIGSGNVAVLPWQGWKLMLDFIVRTLIGVAVSVWSALFVFARYKERL